MIEGPSPFSSGQHLRCLAQGCLPRCACLLCNCCPTLLADVCLLPPAHVLLPGGYMCLRRLPCRAKRCNECYLKMKSLPCHALCVVGRALPQVVRNSIYSASLAAAPCHVTPAARTLLHNPCALQPRLGTRATSAGRRGVRGSPLPARPARPGPPLIRHRPRGRCACGHPAGSRSGNPADGVPDPAGRAESRAQPAAGGAAAVAAAAGAHPTAQRAARASRARAARCGAHAGPYTSAMCLKGR